MLSPTQTIMEEATLHMQKAAMRQGKKFGAVRLKRIVDRLNGIDRDFKAGLTGDREALDTFIAETLTRGRQN